MKNIERALITFLLVWLLFPAAHAHAEQRDREIKAGVFNFKGYHDKDKNGNLTGYGIDLLRLLSEYSHLNFIFTGFEQSWKNIQQMLLDGEIDLVSSARKSPEREAMFAFSLPVGRNHTILARQIHNTKLRAGDYSTYDNMKVGVIAGSSQNSYLPKFAKEKGFKYTTVEYDSPQELSAALQKGEVDAIISSSLRKPENETTLDILQSDNFYIIARKEDQPLIDEINYAIEQMNLNEGDWQNELSYRHYGPALSKIPELSGREKNFISSLKNGEKELLVTANSANPPYSFVENGTLQGILPDYFKKLMEGTDIPYKFITSRSLAAKKSQDDNFEADVVLDSLIPVSLKENQQLEGFATDIYLGATLATVTRRGFSGSIKTVAIPENLPFKPDSELLRGKEIQYYQTPQQAMEAVESKKADAAYVLPYAAQMYLNRNSDSGLYYTMTTEGMTNFRMFVPGSSDHEIVTIINKAIKSLPGGIINQLAYNYVSFHADEMSLLHYLYANPLVFFTGILAIVLASSLFFMMWLRGKWNRRLLSATESANRELAGQLAIVEALSRDYSNVLAINPDSATASLIKITGFDPGEDQNRISKAKDYNALIQTYINQKVYPSEQASLAKALSLPVVQEKLTTQNEYSGTFRVVHAGEVQHFQFTFVKPESAGKNRENLVLVGFRNIDELLRKEQEQKKILAEALAQSRYANHAKTTFLNNMSHDIRTPMNAILGFTSLASSNLHNIPLVTRYLGKIMVSGNHLLNLINDVLDMSRIESGKIKIEPQELKLPDILWDLRTIVLSDVKRKNLKFNIYAINITNEVIFCDKLRLNQVLLNILSNAIKYTPEGGEVALTVSQADIKEDGKAVYEFSVQDNGIGMSEEFLRHVFEPFEREQTATVSGIQGTGLGLAITKNIVDLMGGQITVKSVQGKGSEFTVIFTMSVKDDGSIAEPMPQFQDSRALVIVNDEKACKKIAGMLFTLGFKPDWTTSAKAGLEKAWVAYELKEDYEACIVELNLGDMTGFDASRELRKIMPKNVPIVMITDEDLPDMESRGKECGITEFISRPVFFSTLRNALNLAEEEPQEEKIEEPAPAFTGKHILLAEDNEMNQEIAQMILENAGFELDIVENGQQAVEKIRNLAAGAYDLILMDVQMPVMNGYDATREIRKMEDKVKASIPIIAMTANAFDEDREEALNAGMNGYVPKPIDIKQLMETLNNILNKK